ncbi:MAG: PqqD family peptide modification chaperone [Halobacteriota archaeon]|nr:PqqD family peptide modification chaperone [Halobacteriota archaeon]
MNPKHIQDVELKRLETNAEVYYILRDQNSGEYFRFSEPEAFIWNLLDGEHSLETIIREVGERFGNVSREVLEVFLKGLEENGLMKGDFYTRRHPDKEDGVKKVSGKLSELLSIKFPILHPDKLCDSIYKRTWWLFSIWMAPIYIVLIVSGLAIFMLNYSTFAGTETIRVWDSGFWGVVLLFFIVTPMGIVHEFSHALACKKFGRHVWEIGIMLYLVQPYLYCDTSDAWFCEKKSERIFVSFAGPLVSLIMACILTLVWNFATLSTFSELLIQRVVYFGFLGVLLGFNPLILLDGYYMLMDVLDVPNLRTDSFDYIGKKISRPFKALAGKESDLGEYTKKQKTAYTIYGSMALLVTSTVLIYSLSIYIVMWDVLTNFFYGLF